MKKILYSVIALAVFGFTTSCTEDKGTSFEVENANNNETVDRSDIRNYARPGTAGKSITGTAEAVADEQTAEQLTRAYYTEPNRPGRLVDELTYSETTNLGGQSTDTNTPPNSAAAKTKKDESAASKDPQQGAERRAKENTKENDKSRNQ